MRRSLPSAVRSKQRFTSKFAMITLGGPRGWGLLGVVWSLAAWGIAKELRSGPNSVPALMLYLAMG
jgi:predicted membrane channel-forming protein YqfA (hemolysin III family)